MYTKPLENQGNLKRMLMSCPRSARESFDTIASFWFRYNKVNFSQSFLANKKHYVRETINRALPKLIELGLIRKLPQARKMPGYTCSYYLAEWITEDMCKALHKILQSFRYFSMKFLCSRTDLFNKEKKVTLVNSSYKVNLLTNPNPYPSQVIKETNYEDNRDRAGKKNTNSKKGKIMNEVVSTPGTNMAKEVLNLTPWGKIRCRLFEDDAILYALAQLSKADRAGGVKDRFSYFFSVAAKYTRDNGKIIDNKRFLRLKEAYNMPDDAQMCEEEEEYIPQKREKYSYKNKEKDKPRAIDPEKERLGRISNDKTEKEKMIKVSRDEIYCNEMQGKLDRGEITYEEAKERIELRLSQSDFKFTISRNS